MNAYVGLTDWDWFNHLRRHNMSEVNFWKPSGQPFKALSEGDMFLFKLKAAHGGRIAGGGFFVSSTITSIDWAWRAFGTENGTTGLAELSNKIWHYKNSGDKRDPNAMLTCIILTDAFYLDERDWFDISDRWSPSIVSGKTFRGQDANALVGEVELRLRGRQPSTEGGIRGQITEAPSGVTLTTVKRRIGQGAFRTLVADAYQRRCAITGERTVPVLQAAHIKSFSSDGPNTVNNGILLRSDMHALFDAGYLTIEYDSNSDSRVVISNRLHDDFGNGKDYYPYHGRRLTVTPNRKELQPSKEYLDWHHEHVFLG
ncbi:HNH endonuclease [Olsenella intestinalis]|uniref:HNH endonuclease n=1 Tax=Olsenella intestinalis TaxID=2930083 RepID=UPI00200F231C|nr:HNH endonuclease [Olsenella intestinalis]